MKILQPPLSSLADEFSMIYFPNLSVTASKLKSSYKRISLCKRPDSISIRCAVYRAKGRIARLSPQCWRTQRLSKRKLDGEVIGEPPPGPLHSSLSLETHRFPNDSPTSLSTHDNDSSSNMEASASPLFEPSSSISDTQDDDVEQAGATPCNTANTPDFCLLLVQQQHANHIAALESEYTDKLRAVVSEKDECMERLKNLTKERDILATQKLWWQNRFVTITKSQSALIYDLQRERNRFVASQKAAETRTKNLEALVGRQQTQHGEMRREIKESESHLAKVREELGSCYQEISLLRKQIGDYESSAVKHFQVYHDVEQYKEEYQNLQGRYQTLELQVSATNANTLKAIAEVEKLKATKSESERGLNAAEARIQTSTLEQLEAKLALSKNLTLEAKEREVILKRRFSTLQENWRVKKEEYANDLSDCRAELRLKDWIIEGVRQQKACYLHIVKEALPLLAGCVDGDMLALRLSQLLTKSLDRNEELELQVLNFHTQRSVING